MPDNSPRRTSCQESSKISKAKLKTNTSWSKWVIVASLDALLVIMVDQDLATLPMDSSTDKSKELIVLIVQPWVSKAHLLFTQSMLSEIKKSRTSIYQDWWRETSLDALAWLSLTMDQIQDQWRPELNLMEMNMSSMARKCGSLILLLLMFLLSGPRMTKEKSVDLFLKKAWKVSQLMWFRANYPWLLQWLEILWWTTSECPSHICSQQLKG